MFSAIRPALKGFYGIAPNGEELFKLLDINAEIDSTFKDTAE